MVMESVAASTSSVPETPPSTEFSIGAISASMSPASRSVVAVATAVKGTCSTVSVNSRGMTASACRSAWWVKVVSGPRYPYRMGANTTAQGRGAVGAAQNGPARAHWHRGAYGRGGIVPSSIQ